MSQPSLKVLKDFTKSFQKTIETLKNKEVLIGIPDNGKARRDDEISNATLLFINNFGSPANNIPARPVVNIGMKNAYPDIVQEMKKAAQAALKGTGNLDKYYERCGVIGSNSIKRVIDDQEGIEHISFATALSRLRKGFNGDKALLVTGQMRNAITYVVKDK